MSSTSELRDKVARVAIVNKEPARRDVIDRFAMDLDVVNGLAGAARETAADFWRAGEAVQSLAAL